MLSLLLPEIVRGAQSGMPRVGILVPELGRSQSQAIKGLREALKQLGYKEGANILLETRDAKGDRGNLQPAAGDLVARKTDVLLTTGTRATQAAKSITPAVPIVFIHPADPTALGLLESDATSARIVTGVAGFALQSTERRLEISREIIPGLQRVHVFFDANNQASRDNVEFTKSAAGRLGLRVIEYGVKSVDELKATVGRVPGTRADAIYYVPDDLVDSEGDFILDSARRGKVATVFDGEAWAIKGSLVAYGPSFYQMGRQAGGLVQAILNGRARESLPVQRAQKFDLTVNYRTAGFIGLPLSRDLLKKADRVIR